MPLDCPVNRYGQRKQRNQDKQPNKLINLVFAVQVEKQQPYQAQIDKMIYGIAPIHSHFRHPAEVTDVNDQDSTEQGNVEQVAAAKSQLSKQKAH